MKKLILGSASMWRKIILEKTGVPFEVMESGFAEDMTLPLSPEKMVQTFALGKALAVAKKEPDAVVIGADTILVRDGVILGKPKSADDAIATLELWSGKSGSAFTGLAIVADGGEKKVEHVIETKIFFRELTRKEIEAYVATGEPLAAAGSFTVLGRGAPFVSRIEGDFYNIAGLPLSVLTEELRAFGF
jgi:septum formation protein